MNYGGEVTSDLYTKGDHMSTTQMVLAEVRV